ncbi:hypothetical protein MST27_06400 [Pseudomonas sp. PS1]|uniref:Uncharacterized protein n=1 Tax=Stutzerimonas marianensis TaxID=2929513 RepID=A0A9X2AUE8_9GAMM|nr:hypothetical protein [Pseudomonas marianensis]MCJ0972996.1 hypothetical protein [Pseudomonas marianensis]
MRSANLIITGGIAAFTTLLAVYTSPVGGRELHYWAMNLGLFSSAALVSWLFFATLLAFKSNRLKGQLLILFGYAASLACGSISGASFGAIYFIMQAEKTTFQAAFQPVSITMIGGYAIAIGILAGVYIYLYKANNPAEGA